MARGGGLSAGLTLGAAFAAFLLFSGRARAESQIDMMENFDLPLIDYENPPAWEPLPIPEFWIDENDPSVKNLSAFLYMIRAAENRLVGDESRYSRFYGNSTFSDLSDHPVITGEKTGVPLSARMCRAAGFPPGCVSTAAGAYQIIKPTWQRVRAAGQWGPYLPDFSPESQDEAARRLLLERGALQRLGEGDFAGAVNAASREWASLPGSRSGQPQRDLSEVISFYEEGLQHG
jgi:lysozyme